MNISSRTIAGVALAALAPMALAADLQVNANEHYFQDWVFNVSDNPRGCTVADVLASTDVITGTLGPLTYRVESLGAVTQSWVDCRWPTFANNIPPGNDHPGTIDTHHNGAGTYRYTFSAPLPAGTVLFMQDFESNEVSEITFLDCRGQPVDASGFDWLRVSAPSATRPSSSPNTRLALPGTSSAPRPTPATKPRASSSAAAMCAESRPWTPSLPVLAEGATISSALPPPAWYLRHQRPSPRSACGPCWPWSA